MLRKKGYVVTDDDVATALDEFGRALEVVKRISPDVSPQQQQTMAEWVLNFLHHQHSGIRDDEKFRITKMRFWTQLIGQFLPWIIAMAAIFKN